MKYIVLVLLFVILSLSSVRAEINTVQAERHYDMAIRMLEKQNYDQAIENYLSAIRFQAQQPDFYEGLAYAYYANGQLTKAIHTYQEALRYRPQSDVLHYNLAVALYDSGQIETALETFKVALRLNPRFVAAYHNIASIYSRQKDYETALKYYRVAWKLAPKDPDIKNEMREIIQPHSHSTEKKEIHFTYEGEEGPEHWGDLSPSFVTCKTGQKQSPIDIPRTQKIALDPIRFDYQLSPLKIINNGHTIQINYAEGSTIAVGERTYQLLQFHFHTPSENVIKGKAFAMEMHLVHKDNAGNLGVVGVMLEPGTENAELQKLWSHLPQKHHQDLSIPSVQINVKALLPVNHQYFSFPGSLTTPPCSEGVQWMVLTTPIQVSEAQINTFKNLFQANARPVQPLNNRTVQESQ